MVNKVDPLGITNLRIR
ncbi:hypothetical protein NAI75_10845 [Francisella tularensis subsp. holarctica]|nr:hypothetical protein [Francisella tularensis subsp. holarctica]